MLSYEYFTSISFKIHLFTPLYFRICLFSRVLQSCACCPAHSSVIFTGHLIGGILVSLGSNTVAVAAQTWLAYPCGWLPELRSSRTLFQRILHAGCVCQLCGTRPDRATLPGVTATARRAWRDCCCHSSGLDTGHSFASQWFAGTICGVRKVPGEPIPQAFRRKPSAVARPHCCQCCCGQVLPSALQLVFCMGTASEEWAVVARQDSWAPVLASPAPEHLS